MYKVIFVDDEPLILEGLQKIIDWQEYGINVIGSATTVDDAMVIIKEFVPEIIITDIRMQGTSGLDMIERLNRDGYKGHIIILSGYRDFEYAQKAIENKVFAYLLKPLDIEKFKKTISEVVENLDSEKKPFEYSANTIEQVIEYIETHFSEDISLGELAKKYHFELSNISRMIKRYTGERYTDYVAKLRVEYAKKYLTETTRSIEEIAELVGYKSVRYFREIFMEYTGFTPSQYRKERRQSKNESKEEEKHSDR